MPAAPATSPENVAVGRGRRGGGQVKSKAPHKVLRLTTYERLDEYLRPSPRGTSIS